jgi:hypothetical protein
MHVDAVGNIAFSHRQLDVGFVVLKTDHLPVFAAAVGLGRAADIDCLQDVRLSLGIVPVKDIGARRKFHM